MQDISYNIICTDNNEVIDGEIETLDTAKLYLADAITRDMEENWEYDWGNFAIQKITREILR